MSSATQVQSNIRWLPLLIVVAAFTALGGLLGFGLVQVRGGNTNLAMDPAPNFTLALYSGGTGQFTLSEQQGHPVVLNFWGSWCPPCRAEFPALQAVASQYEEEGLVVFGVDVQDAEVDARAFLNKQGTTFPTGPDTTSRVTIDYNVINFPTTFFVTSDGRIYKRWVGQIDEANLTTFIEELLVL